MANKEIFKGIPNSKYEADYQLYNPSKSFLLRKEGNKYVILKTFKSPIESLRYLEKLQNKIINSKVSQSKYNDYKLHYTFNDSLGATKKDILVQDKPDLIPKTEKEKLPPTPSYKTDLSLLNPKNDIYRQRNFKDIQLEYMTARRGGKLDQLWVSNNNTHYLPKNLLGSSSYKTRKGGKKKIATYILYLSPEKASGRANLCAFATPECANGCLATSGQAGMPTGQVSQRNKTVIFGIENKYFLDQLYREIYKLREMWHNKEPRTLPWESFCVRLNGTSDITWENLKITAPNGTVYENIFKAFPDVQFYDYTKNIRRIKQPLPKNYDITFSRAETEDNQNACIEAMKLGYRVAVVFNRGKYDKKTKTFQYAFPAMWHGFEVVDGDDTDLRFLDPTKVVVGLSVKGIQQQKGAREKWMKQEQGFFVQPDLKGDFKKAEKAGIFGVKNNIIKSPSDLVGKRFSYEVGTRTDTLTASNKQSVIDSLKDILRQYAFDTDFYYNGTDTKHRDEYFEIYKKDFENPVLKNIDKNFNKYFLVDTKKNIVYWNRSKNINLINNFFKTNKNISKILKEDFMKYRKADLGGIEVGSIKDFEFYLDDGNVIFDGQYYRTQDALYKNKLTEEGLIEYYFKEFMQKRLVKGSKEAKLYMAKLRAKKDKIGKVDSVNKRKTTTYVHLSRTKKVRKPTAKKAVKRTIKTTLMALRNLQMQDTFTLGKSGRIIYERGYKIPNKDAYECFTLAGKKVIQKGSVKVNLIDESGISGYVHTKKRGTKSTVKYTHKKIGATSTHNDTKSHNYKITIGALKNQSNNDYNDVCMKILSVERGILDGMIVIKNKTYPKGRLTETKKSITFMKKYLAELKKQKSELKKLL